jgi:hypothetical protein
MSATLGVWEIDTSFEQKGGKIVFCGAILLSSLDEEVGSLPIPPHPCSGMLLSIIKFSNFSLLSLNFRGSKLAKFQPNFKRITKITKFH